MTDQPSNALQLLAAIALEAGRDIMRIYGSDDPAVRIKSDLSPVTAADEAAEAIILDRLRAFDPATPIVSEEQAAGGHTPKVGQAFYLVDPLDGTREFLSRNGEFTVNIARIENGAPVAGVVYAPALGRIHCGAQSQAWASVIKDGEIDEWRPVHVASNASSGPVIVASRSHRDARTDEFIAARQGARLTSVGSSLKFCMIACGEADIYPRFGRTMEWDTAAGHAVLAAAGGKVLDESGQPLVYGKLGFENPAFIASN
jgi:3'(2'), 5'-bisphosphate nucleotidase